MDELTYEEIINRVGYFRSKANLSLRETSLRLGYNPQFMKTIENKSIELKVKTLLEFCAVVGVSPIEFICFNKFNAEDIKMLEAFHNLTEQNKETILNLMKNLK